MDITYDARKRAVTLEERGLDFEDAKQVLEGEILFEGLDTRRDYGEPRVVTIGLLRGRMVVIGWTPRGNTCRVFSMRKATDREKARFG